MQVAVQETPSPKKLLVVDDDPENLALLERAFREEFEIHRAQDGKEALAIARQVRKGPDAIGFFSVSP